MAKTQLRLGQLTGSFGSAAGTINDQITPTATGSMVASDLSTVLAHMAGAIKRIHGGDSFSESQTGIFTTDIKPESNNSRVLGADIAGTPLSTPFHSSISADGLVLSSDTKIVRMTSIPQVIGQEAASGDFLAIGDFRATLAADPDSTVTFAQTFGSSLSTSGMGSTLDSSTTSIPFVSASALVAALGDDIRGGDTIVIGSFSATVSSTYSSGASLSVSSGSGSQAVSGISGSTTTTLSAGGTSGAPGGLAVTPVNGTASVSGSEISGGAATFIGRGFSKVRALNLEMNGGGRIDLDFDQDTSIRASADDVISIEVGGSDKLTVNASAIAPTGAAGMDLGTSALGFNDLHLDADGVINFDGGDVTMTHSSNLLNVSGGSLRADKLELDASNHIDVDGSSDLVMTSGAALKLDSATDIVLDAAGDEVIFKDGSTNVGHVSMDDDNLTLKSLVSDKDIIFQGSDGGSDVTALTLDMSEAGKATFGGNIVIPDAGNIGSASDADALAIASSGVVTFSQRDVHSAGITVADGAQIGSASDADAMVIASSGAVTFSQRDIHSGGITVADGAQIGSASDLDAMAIASDGVVTFSQRDVHSAGITVADGAQIGSASATNAITIASDGKVTLAGDLEVAGSTTTVSTANLLVEDKLVTLNDGGSASSGGGAGIEVEEDGSATGFFKVAADRAGWELQAPGNSNTLTIDATASSVLLDVGADVTIDGSLSVESASVINQDLSSDSTSAALGVLTMATRLAADTNGGADIGTASVGFGDVYLADDKKLQFGDDQDFTIEYDEDGENVAQLAGANVRIGHGANTELQFRDSALKIHSSADGQLDAAADVLAKVTSPTVELEASTSIQMDSPIVDFEDDGVVLQFGDDDDVTLTHVHDAGLLLNASMALQFGHASHKISAGNSSGSDMTIAAGGRILMGNHVIPATDDASGLGVSSQRWADLFMAEGAVMSIGSTSQALTLTHSQSARLGTDLSSHLSGMNPTSFTTSDSGIEFISDSSASSFADALGGGGTTVRFNDGSGNVIDFLFSSYMSGDTVSISSATQVSGSSVSKSGIQSSGAINIKELTDAHQLSIDGDNASLNIQDHDGADHGLKLAGTLVTSTAAELNLLDGGRSLDSSITIVDGDGVLINDGGSMKMVPASALKTFVGGGRAKNSVTLTAAVDTDSLVTVTGASHDQGADPDLSDIYLNGQLMLSGSSAANGDYQINGASRGSSLSVSVGSLTSGQTFTTSTTSVGFDSAIGTSTADALPNGSDKVFVMENSAGTVRLEGDINGSLSGGSTSIAINNVRIFNPNTGAAVSSLAVADVSSMKAADSVTESKVRFFFALEADDVVTITKV